MVKKRLKFRIRNLLTLWVNLRVLKDLMNKFVDLATSLRHFLVIKGLLYQWALKSTMLLNLFCLLRLRKSLFKVRQILRAANSLILGIMGLWLLLIDLWLLLYLLIKIRLQVWLLMIRYFYAFFLLLQLLRSFIRLLNLKFVLKKFHHVRQLLLAIFNLLDFWVDKLSLLLGTIENSIQFLLAFGSEIWRFDEFRVPFPFNTFSLKGSFESLHVSLSKCSPFIGIKAIMLWFKHTILAQVDVEFLWLAKAELSEIIGYKLLRPLYFWIAGYEILTKLIGNIQVDTSTITFFHNLYFLVFF